MPIKVQLARYHSRLTQRHRYMPPTIPVLGRSCFSIVFAQLIVNGEKRGTRPFIVQLNDGIHMSEGICAK